jgi:hypothetical protein
MITIDGADKRYLNSTIKQTAICSLINLNRGWHEQCADFSEAKRMERIVWVAVEKFREALNAVAGPHRIRLAIPAIMARLGSLGFRHVAWKKVLLCYSTQTCRRPRSYPSTWWVPMWMGISTLPATERSDRLSTIRRSRRHRLLQAA